MVSILKLQLSVTSEDRTRAVNTAVCPADEIAWNDLL